MMEEGASGRSISSSAKQSAAGSSASSSSSRAAAVLELAQETEISLLKYCQGLSSSHGIHISRIDIEREVRELKERSYSSPVPETTLLGGLVRRFIDVANTLKLAHRPPLSVVGGSTKEWSSRSDTTTGMSGYAEFFRQDSILMDRIPTWLYDGREVDLTALFKLRIATAILSLTSFIIMGNVRSLVLGHSKLYPGLLFNSGCAITCTSGDFDVSAFRASLSIAVATYVYSLSCIMHYLLPIDNNGLKYIPSLEQWLGDTSTWGSYRAYIDRFRALLRDYSYRIELGADALLLAVSLPMCVSASVILERGSRFTFSGSGSLTDLHFTLGTFYTTFQNTNPVCLSSGGNTTRLIRASLAMVYINLPLLVMTLVLSLRLVLRQWGSGIYTPDGAREYSKVQRVAEEAQSVVGERSVGLGSASSSDGFNDVVEVDL